MAIIESGLIYLDSYLGAARYFPFLLLGTGLFFTIYLKFPQILYFKHAWKVLLGKYDKSNSEGDVSHFQALTTALAGTVGTGNIGGVALAIYLGGPAALFWMWITAFLGMTTKFVEVTLSHKYRIRDAQGFMAGGPMYYMERRLNMKWLAVLFAVFTVISSFGSGNMPQSNNIAQGLQSTFNIPPLFSGLFLSFLVGLVILGGIKRIVHVTEKIVPIMSLIYVLGALSVILTNYEQIIPSFISIITYAFSGSAAIGGFLGASFAYAFNRGVNRGLFSNEAGQGSSAIAHAAAKTDEPVSEGMVSILEPFIDTIIICTLTGLVILSSGVWTEKFKNEFQTFDMEFISGVYTESNEEHRQSLFEHLNFGGRTDEITTYSGTISIVDGKAVSGNYTIIHNRSIAEKVTYAIDQQPFTGDIVIIDGQLENSSLIVTGYSLVHSVTLTIHAFTRGVMGEYGKYVVSIGLLLFAFSTVVAWSYYGDRAITYLFGVKWVTLYRCLYIIGFFVASISDTSLIWLLSAITTTLMTIPNLVGILFLRKEMKNTVGEYWRNFRKP
ncbi:MAG: sodium:alanine symporter family protein [Emcibacteraceae bacterium]|nr:sodium:alanine symporter family protein [Emcibacteraceae bacterium]